MTFYELEKECKRRKRNFIIKIILLIILLILAFLGIIYYTQYKSLQYPKEKTKQNIIKKVKSVKKEQINKSENKHLKNKKQPEKLLPLIDLNIKEPKELNKTDTDTKKQKTKIQTPKSNMVLESKTLPSFETCIKLSQMYLNKKDYQNALKWAKFANIQNKKDPLSWILSAKALYAEGKKEQAIKLLKIYNTYYNNKDIQKLIKEFNEK